MALSPEEKADIAFMALKGEQPLEALAQSHQVALWQVVEWAIALRQKGHGIFAESGAKPPFIEPLRTPLAWRTIFIHLPKTAGTALTSHLEDVYPLSSICPARRHDQIEDLALLKNLASFDLFCGHFFYSWILENANFATDTRYVTLLRDPVKRAISSYHHWMREPQRGYRHVSPLISDANVQCMYLSPLSMRAPHYSLRDHLKAAKEALAGFFFVGIQERFAQSLDLLHKTMGICAPSEARVRNAAKELSPPQFSTELLDEIASANWADMELYAFALSLFEQRLQQSTQTQTEPLSFGSDVRLPNAVHFVVSDPIDGDNWHEREGLEQDHPWRWSGPGTHSHLKFKLAIDKDAQYRLSVYVVNAMSAEILSTMRVSINGVAVEVRQARDADDRFFLEGEVSGIDIASRSGEVEVCMDVEGTLSHFEVDPKIDDRRPCGFALCELHLLPG